MTTLKRIWDVMPEVNARIVKSLKEHYTQKYSSIRDTPTSEIVRVIVPHEIIMTARNQRQRVIHVGSLNDLVYHWFRQYPRPFFDSRTRDFTFKPCLNKVKALPLSLDQALISGYIEGQEWEFKITALIEANCKHKLDDGSLAFELIMALSTVLKDLDSAKMR